MPGFIGFPEMIVLGVIVLLVFGPKRLPEMGRSMGKGFREFKNSISGGDDKTDADPYALPMEAVDYDLEPVATLEPAPVPARVASLER